LRCKDIDVLGGDVLSLGVISTLCIANYLHQTKIVDLFCSA